MNHRHHDHRPALGLALAITAGFALVEALAGWQAGSLALLGDAGHMLTDSSALGIAYLAQRLTQRRASKRHSFGLGRVEIVAALFNATLMLLLVAILIFGALRRLSHPVHVHGDMTAGVALVGLLVNGVVLKLLHSHGHDLNTRGAALHVMGDLLGSIAALASGVVISLTGWYTIDPLLSVLIGGLIVFSSIRIVTAAVDVVLEAVPAHLDLQEIGQAMAATPGVHSVHDLHVWSISSHLVALSAHVVIDDLTIWPEALARLRELLRKRFAIEHVTLQPEPCKEALLYMPQRPSAPWAVSPGSAARAD
jgi:cobalt-zinc-cadmium efflux system protein